MNEGLSQSMKGEEAEMTKTYVHSHLKTSEENVP